MNPDHRTPAELTAASVLQAAHGSVPIMIPGARETRARPRVDAVAATTATSLVRERGDALRDAGRLEYEREGGGAPSERRNGSDGVRFGRLRHWLFGSRS